jgi:hypothetical protein
MIPHSSIINSMLIGTQRHVLCPRQITNAFDLGRYLYVTLLIVSLPPRLRCCDWDSWSAAGSAKWFSLMLSLKAGEDTRH